MTTEVSSALPASRSLVRQLRLPAPALIALALVAPSVVWAGIDRSIWWWDQSLYASGSVDLWATLRLRTRIWPDAMAHVLGVWPPAISWIGQFFVPFGGLVGSDDVALLLSVDLALAVAVALLYVTGLR